jgi:hypothetical protein
VALRVFPVAYLLSALVAMTVGLFARAASDDYRTTAQVAGLLSQFIALFVLLPGALGRAHRLGFGRSVALGMMLAIAVFLINVIAIVFIGMEVQPAMAPLDGELPPVMSPRPR